MVASGKAQSENRVSSEEPHNWDEKKNFRGAHLRNLFRPCKKWTNNGTLPRCIAKQM